MDVLSNKLQEKLKSENLDDTETKRDLIASARVQKSSGEAINDVCSYLNQNWEDADMWLVLAEMYEMKQL